MYHYSAHMVRAVDGDTIDVILDLGFGIMFGNGASPQRLRIADIDTPELNSKDEDERERAQAAQAFVKGFEGTQIRVQTRKTSKGKERQTFGRYVADVEVCLDGVWHDLAMLLLENGHAERWS
jgi:micrococcal nuclease